MHSIFEGNKATEIPVKLSHLWLSPKKESQSIGADSCGVNCRKKCTTSVPFMDNLVSFFVK